MKILIIGDFHGKFLKKIPKIIKKEKVDLIVSLGDFFPFSFKKIWFEHCYGKKIELWEVIGKKKVRGYIFKDLKQGEKVLQFLDGLNVPIITVVGNIDYTRINDCYENDIYQRIKWKWERQDFFSKIIKRYKNIKRFDYSYLKFGNYVFIGAYGGSSNGQVKSNNFKGYKKILDNLFTRFKKENKEKRVIFVSHNVPYNTKLDLVNSKDAHKKAKGKHLGSKLVRRTIEKYKPFLYFGGHVHESSGLDKLGKTILVNPGAVYDNQMVLVNLSENNKSKFNIKFIK